jgi:hypothetical protein
MSMTRKDFEAIAETLAHAQVQAEAGHMSLEEFRQYLGRELMNDCHRAYTGGSSFSTSKFKKAAKLDD